MTKYPSTIHVTKTMAEQIDTPLERALISSRTGRGTASVHYVKGDITADQLNSVFGPLGWGLVAKIHQIDDWEEEKSIRDGNSTRTANMHVVQVISDVTLTIKKVNPESTDTIFVQPGIGYGEIEIGKNRKEAVGMAVKGSATDGLKRCASMLGKAFGMMMASNGSQEDIEYAHNGNQGNLTKAKGYRRDDERNRSDGERGSGAQDESRPRHEPEARRQADNRQSTDARRGNEEARPRDESRREERSPGRNEQKNEARDPAPRADEAKVADTDTKAKVNAKKQVTPPPTNFNLNGVPISNDEMLSFAATLVERVKEMTQAGDKVKLVKQHLNTINNLDSKIRTRLMERLDEQGVDVNTIPS